MQIPRTLAVILAGGKGSRLGALTETRVKPALPVAGTYRLIDVALSNLQHSHLSDVWIVQQYLAPARGSPRETPTRCTASGSASPTSTPSWCWCCRPTTYTR